MKSLAAALIVIAAGALPAWAQGGRPPSLAEMWSRGKAEGRGSVKLTVSPMDPSALETYVPYGLMVGEHVTPIDHAYLVPKNMRETKRDQFDVLAPADGKVVLIEHRTRMEGTDSAGHEYDDWRLVLEHTGTFYTYYDLLTSVEEAITKGMTPEGGGQRLTGRVAVKAGQRIGKIGTRTLDFGAVNTEVTLQGFAIPEHYEREPWKIHTVDPFDYFTEPVRTQLLAINPRTKGPRGGKIDFDVDGKLVGNWFLAGTNGYAGGGDKRGYWAGHASFVYHHIDADKIVVSLGDWGGKCQQFGVRGNGPDPATVGKEAGVVKYDLVMIVKPNGAKPFEGMDPRSMGVLLVQLVEARKLKLEAFPGKSPDEVRGFSEASTTYER
ncbi:MAG: hypothetical protein AAB074_04630 [Planctomycetota bacterium]